MNFIEELVNDIITLNYEYLSQCEKNSTENEKQIALLEIKSSELQANTELAEVYFNDKMDDRERLFHSALEALNKAMCVGDIDYARIAIRTIEIIHKQSPFSF